MNDSRCDFKLRGKSWPRRCCSAVCVPANDCIGETVAQLGRRNTLASDEAKSVDVPLAGRRATGNLLVWENREKLSRHDPVCSGV
jgi:hypothetical protein